MKLMNIPTVIWVGINGSPTSNEWQRSCKVDFVHTRRIQQTDRLDKFCKKKLKPILSHYVKIEKPVFF